MKILLVEDDNTAIDTCKEYAVDYNKTEIELEIAKNVSEALHILNLKDIDCAIIDLRLGNTPDAGNEIANKIKEICLRIPAVAYTGTPGNVHAPFVKVFYRDQYNYDQVFDYLHNLNKTGIKDVLGKTGWIESELNNFFNKIFPMQADDWANCANEVEEQNSLQLKLSLLKTLILHFENYLQNRGRGINECRSFFAECYVFNQSPILTTGAIFKRLSDRKYFIVMSPACDLVVRPGGNRNVDMLTLCELKTIEDFGLKKRFADEPEISNNLKDKLNQLLANKKNQYHWLPPIADFSGGFVDFTKVCCEKIDGYDSTYSMLQYKVSPPFVKNILARFSSYYARQGQPDLQTKSFIKQLTPNNVPNN
ncbi:MAG: response regulator [Fibrobacteraceae bacterium]|nr:response regulator [Fibrobacteraceae bacterium]